MQRRGNMETNTGEAWEKAKGSSGRERWGPGGPRRKGTVAFDSRIREGSRRGAAAELGQESGVKRQVGSRWLCGSCTAPATCHHRLLLVVRPAHRCRKVKALPPGHPANKWSSQFEKLKRQPLTGASRATSVLRLLSVTPGPSCVRCPSPALEGREGRLRGRRDLLASRFIPRAQRHLS